VLFNRTKPSVCLTEIGERCLERMQSAPEQLNNAFQEPDREASQPAGLLRINVPRAARLILMQTILRRLMAEFPEFNLKIRVENLLVDIVSQGFDAGNRFSSSVEKDTVAVRSTRP
jgi:DNA-binding transcriptional LysR family regulator